MDPGQKQSVIKGRVQSFLSNSRLIQFVQIWLMIWALLVLSFSIYGLVFEDNNSFGGVFGTLINIYSM